MGRSVLLSAVSGVSRGEALTYTLLNMIVNTAASAFVGWMCCMAWRQYRDLKRIQAQRGAAIRLRDKLIEINRNPRPISDRTREMVANHRRIMNMKIGEE